ncbi:hypothetical protein DCC62_12450 [candidate division KSB1 bacterium]|nr:MAG: hypothetical protein DCC62_12450 [candidate division KSB1 bacterium]
MKTNYFSKGENKKMKPFMTLIISVLFISPCFAQQDLLPAYPREITYTAGIAYFNGSPFTGLLVDEKTNKKLGEFKNGKKMGMFTENYTNGKKKNEGNYIYGAEDGTHIEWYENGNKQSESKYSNGVLNGQYFEWSEDGELKSDIVYQNGKSIKEAFYKSGLKDGIWKTDDGYTRKEVTYRDGALISEANYSKGVLDGRQIEYLANGKTKETNYQNGEIISEGILINDKQDGKWRYWLNNDKTIERIYKDGELIKEETKIVANLISRFIPSNKSFLFSTREDNKVFFRFDFNLRNTNEYTNSVINTVKANLSTSKRLSQVIVNETNVDESINYFIECTGINVTSETMTCKTSKTSAATAYIANIAVSFALKNAEGGYIDSDTYTSTNKGFLLTTCVYSFQEAFTKANNTDYLEKFIDKHFPVKTFITGIGERNKKGELESVSIEGGDDIGISKSKFYVYEENGNSSIGIIKAKEISYGSTLCKVVEGGNVISAKLASGAKLKVVSIPD